MVERVERPKRATGPVIVKDDIERIRSGPATVTVACKLPTGLILRVFDWQEYDEPILGGGVRRTKVARPTGETVKINGNAAPMDGKPVPFTIIDAHRRGDGFGLTHNVDAEFFSRWLEANKDAPYVREQLIWAYADMGDVSAKARELEKVTSGLEPLDPESDPRTPRGIATGNKADQGTRAA